MGKKINLEASDDPCMFQFRRFPQYTYFEFQCIVPEYEPR